MNIQLHKCSQTFLKVCTDFNNCTTKLLSIYNLTLGHLKIRVPRSQTSPILSDKNQIVKDKVP